MREYVASLLLDFYDKLTNRMVGEPIMPNTLQIINGKLDAYMRDLKWELQLPEINSISVSIDIVENDEILININGLESLPPCCKVILTEETSFGCKKYLAKEVETGRVIGYCEEGPNVRGIAMMIPEHRYYSHPFPVVVVEVNDLQKIGGYWIELENQGRKTCLYCDNILVKKGSYLICEECDK